MRSQKSRLPLDIPSHIIRHPLNLWQEPQYGIGSVDALISCSPLRVEKAVAGICLEFGYRINGRLVTAEAAFAGVPTGYTAVNPIIRGFLPGTSAAKADPIKAA